MSDGEALTEPLPSPAVPPATRLGAVLGWGLPVLGVACLAACLQAGISADSARHAWDAALDHAFGSMAGYDAAVAAEAAYHGATLRANLLSIAACLTLFALPGLLYAARPSLLGGPVGRVLRTASAKWAPQHPQRKRPITFYQGLGLLLFGMGWVVFWLGAIVTTLTPIASAGLWPIYLIFFAGLFMSFPLMGGSWWF